MEKCMRSATGVLGRAIQIRCRAHGSRDRACSCVEDSRIDGAAQVASEHQAQIPERTEKRRPSAHRLLIIASSGKTRDFRSNVWILASASAEPAHRPDSPFAALANTFQHRLVSERLVPVMFLQLPSIGLTGPYCDESTDRPIQWVL
jgi:hypothetical protein